MTVEYNLGDPSVIFDLLSENAESANVADSITVEDMSFYKKAMSVAVSVDILGINNVNLSVSENGYIQTNILGTRKLFYIGEERAQRFFDYVKENFETVREEVLVPTTTAPDPSVSDDVVVTAVTQITPGYDPTKDAIVLE